MLTISDITTLLFCHGRNCPNTDPQTKKGGVDLNTKVGTQRQTRVQKSHYQATLTMHDLGQHREEN